MISFKRTTNTDQPGIRKPTMWIIGDGLWLMYGSTKYVKMSSSLMKAPMLMLINDVKPTNIIKDFLLKVIFWYSGLSIFSNFTDSPAEKAGIVEGQILVSVNDYSVLTTDHADIIELIQKSKTHKNSLYMTHSLTSIGGQY